MTSAVSQTYSQENLCRSAEIFTTGEIATLLDASMNQVDYWVRCQLLSPSVRLAYGHGSRRLFNREDLQQALLVQRLQKANWKPKHIHKALNAVMAAFNNPEALHTPLLIHEGNAFLILCREKGKEPELVDAASPGQRVLVIALEALREETLRSLARSK
ncbi:MAG: MerR family transcriptional regulator [Armatimonadota bacterium]|nr:MerR family transcriptional regulator [Armatimonadota bacterium]